MDHETRCIVAAQLTAAFYSGPRSDPSADDVIATFRDFVERVSLRDSRREFDVDIDRLTGVESDAS